MDGDENYVFFAIYKADFVGSPAAFSEWDVGFFGDEQEGIVAFVCEVGDEACGDVAVETVFEEASVGAAFSGCVGAVAVVDKDFHCVVVVL